MNNFQVFNVAPAIPAKITFLETLSYNLWWSWHADAVELFRRIDRDLWKTCGSNPIVFLNRVAQEHLESLSANDSFMAHLERVRAVYDQCVVQPCDKRPFEYRAGETIAYFSAEFGIHESVPLFAGGLGVLAGDHLKAASNMDLPLVAVGLLYRHGYFRQYLNNDGWQQETYPENEIHELPLQKVMADDDNQLMLHLPIPGAELRALVWKIQVGRIPLYLLDSNVPENSPEMRHITAQLYGGDERTRLLQEILLGIGGIRALAAMGIHPSVCHMNEGHSAFISLERLAYLIRDHGLDLADALEIVRRTNVFTTHTPVAAGHDEFPPEMVRPFVELLHERLGVPADTILAWGRAIQAPVKAPFSMTILALHMAQDCNGVSELHGRVARRMWQPIWPGKPEHEVPIGHITNGVHTPSWVSPENILLFDRYLGPNWHQHPGDTDIANRIDQIPDDELWRARQLGLTRLIRESRLSLVRQLSRRHAPQAEIEKARSVLDPNTLTIGFARRFATYKRATLLLKDPQRIMAMLNSSERPIQLIVSGKAHPQDNEGKELIRQIIHFARREEVRDRIIFIEDYNIDIARYLLQGVDVWLNTPRRPQEASGTSGMKAAVNGALNVSVLDGWWCEGYTPERGWSIGNGEEYQDEAYQDDIESKALYYLLEQQVAPCFYDRSPDQIPLTWVQMMKASMKMAFCCFSSHRMLREYETAFYTPAIERSRMLQTDNWAAGRALSARQQRLNKHWKSVRIEPPHPELPSTRLRVGDIFQVTSTVHLGELQPDEVLVECYYGTLRQVTEITKSHRVVMKPTADLGEGRQRYECTIACKETGRFGLTARVMPQGDAWTRHQPGFLTWSNAPS